MNLVLKIKTEMGFNFILEMKFVFVIEIENHFGLAKNFS